MSAIIPIMAAMVDQSIKIVNDIRGCEILLFQATMNGANGAAKMKVMNWGNFLTKALSTKKEMATKR